MNVKHIFTAAPLGSIPELPALSCHEIKASEDKHTISGKYWLDPTRKGKAKLIYCDMVNEGRSYNFAWVMLFCNESSVSWNYCKLYYYWYNYWNIWFGSVLAWIPLSSCHSVNTSLSTFKIWTNVNLTSMTATWMQTVLTRLVLINARVKWDTSAMDTHVQVILKMTLLIFPT